MTIVLAICVVVVTAVSLYLLTGRELKSIAMGVFLLGHAANLSIIAMSRSPVIGNNALKSAPILTDAVNRDAPLNSMVDPLPQALILTAIVIGFAVMAFLLSLLVVTARQTATLDTDDLHKQAQAG
jgi:multicomponent Na+:H+ antiporter subunit C